MSSRRVVLRVVIVSLVITLIAGAVVYAAAGSSSDPLVTLSYLNGTFKDTLTADIAAKAERQAQSLNTSLERRIQSFTSNLPAYDVPESDAETEYETVNLENGTVISLKAGSEVLFLSGSATVSSAGLTDTTAGTALTAGAALTANHLYVATGDCTLKAGATGKILMK